MKCYYCNKKIKDGEPKKVVAALDSDNPVYAHTNCWDRKSRVKRMIRR